jgi:hypothetical protein
LERLGRVRKGCIASNTQLLWKALRLCIGSFTTTDNAAKLSR